MDKQTSFGEKGWELPSPQYRMRRLQIYNWGTFSNLHDISIAVDGFLFVGRSGSGKSTLLDAMSALLVPPIWLGFNTAAREGDKGRYDRNLPSYIRGAWADQEDSGSGEIVTQYLRPNSTWSALALEYVNDSGAIISLIQIFWLKGSSIRTTDVRRHLIIAERAFNISTELKAFDLDLRKLKSNLEDVYHFETFKPYSERFRRLLGIESEMALKLLHKTQSAKNLGDLNEFLRDFMLDKPQTFDVAERMVQEFAELDAAHQAVVTARKQVDMLKPARANYEQSLNIDGKLRSIDELLDGIGIYRDKYKKQLLLKELDRLRTENVGLDGQEERQKEILDNHKTQLRILENAHRERGGGQIEQLVQEKEQKERERNHRLGKRTLAEKACKELGWILSDTPQGHAELVAKAKDIVERWKKDNDRDEQQRDKLRDARKEVEKKFTDIRKEIDALQRQSSNIPSHMLELRQLVTDKLGLTETDLPFVGELIEVKGHENDWQGSIERVLHGFALSILVDDKHYAAVSRFVNETQLNKRLVYHRIVFESSRLDGTIQHNSLINKLNLKETSYKDWLAGELRSRFNYVCVENLRDFRQAERAITREGQVRHGKSRHEKDDRYAIDNRLNWVLGFDNRDKLKLYQEQAGELGAEISRLAEALNVLEQERGRRQTHYDASHNLVNLQWQEIDVAGILDRIHMLEKQLSGLRSENRELKDLGEQIEKVTQKIEETNTSLNKIGAGRISVGNNIKSHTEDLEKLELQLTGSFLTEQQHQGLESRFIRSDREITLKNIDNQCTGIVQELNKEKHAFEQERSTHISSIEKVFLEFKREWPAESSHLDSTFASISEFMALLQRLENDGLPKYEERFYEMLKNQSTENLAALNKHMTQARKEIRERMELVNESLANAEFNPGTHLRIEVNERYLPDVKEFREQVSKVLENAWDMDKAGMESRFTILRDIVKKMGSQETEHQRWRDQVLDVRQHVEFIARESDIHGKEMEIYRSGAGKSGGQREKLATTCLAAALRYQLGGTDDDIPVYAPVILDEAFGKADNEFTELAMKIFTTFGFQMIVATPLKSVMTLEPFIGGACFIDIVDRKRSSTLQIEYDQQNSRLNLPERARAEVFSN